MIASREYVKDLIAKIFKLQTGEICAFMATKAPRGFLICDGSTYNINDYKNLARFFNNQFGSINHFGGDGETTFSVPDLRGEFLRGSGANSHTNCGNGSNVGVHQEPTQLANIQNYQNSTIGIDVEQSGWNTSTYADSNISSRGRRYRDVGISYHASGDTNVITARPTNTSVLYCIRY